MAELFHFRYVPVRKSRGEVDKTTLSGTEYGTASEISLHGVLGEPSKTRSG